MRYTAKTLKAMGFSKQSVSGGPKNTKLALASWRKKGYRAMAVKGDSGKTGKYVNREIWTKRKK